MAITDPTDPIAGPLKRQSILDPVSRASEILFGLIMVLTFTASFNAASSNPADVRLMLVAALGCNLAWGLIDAAMYLMSTYSERALSMRTVRTIQAAPSPQLGRIAVRQALPNVVAEALPDDDLEKVRIHVNDYSAENLRASLVHDDFTAATAIFLAVFLSTIPVALPFAVFDDPVIALRTSHAVAIALLFAAGWALGRNWDRPWQVGLAMVGLGLALVSLAMALGG